MSDVDNRNSSDNHNLDQNDLIAAARKLWGKETKRGKTEWRFGAKGSKKIDLVELVWFDFEADEGEGIEELCRRAGINGSYHPAAARDAKKSGDKWEPGTPPAEAPLNLLTCDRLYTYTAANGTVTHYVKRFEKPARRFLPLTWGTLNSVTGWHLKAPTPPLPLYRLEDLHELDPELVLLCEGEKAADAANAKIAVEQLPWLAMSWYGGASRAKDADVSSLAGRKIIVWPDADKPGLRARDVLMKMIDGAAALDVSGLREGFDAADLTADEKIEAFVKTRMREAATEAKPADATPAPANWLALCIRGGGKKSAPLNNAANIYIGLANDTGLKDAVRFNEMTRTTTVHHVIGKPEAAIKPRQIADHDYCAIQRHLHHKGLKTAGFDPVAREVDEYSRKNSYHPVKDWLESLKWDGTERLRTWLATATGAERDEYTAAIGELFLIAMVARIFEPGCKADYMIILEGEQGEEKSKLCRILAGEWWSENLPDITSSGKDASLHLRGKWLIEIPEMHAFNKAESTHLKQFISRTHEMYRPPYGRADVNEPRQNLFIGTTNKEIYLKDETGGRRFWPVKVKTKAIQLEWLTANREALFAEAVQLYRKGYQWWPTREFEREYIQPEQDKRFDSDAWEEPIAEYIKNKIDVTILEIAKGALDYGRTRTTTPFGEDPGIPDDHHGSGGTPVNRLGRADQNRIAAILTNLGWERAQRSGNRKPWRKRASPDAEPL